MPIILNPLTLTIARTQQGETGLSGVGSTGPQGLNGTNGVSPQLLTNNPIYIDDPSDNFDGTYTIKLYFAEGNLPYFLSTGCTIYDSLGNSYKVISYDTVLYPNGNTAFQDGGNVVISGTVLPTQDTDFNSRIWTVIDGATGVAGINGTQGVTGLPGYVGSDGSTGPQGIQGIQGVTGLNGIDGSTGPIGVTGGFYGPTGIFSGVYTDGLAVTGNLVNLNTLGVTGTAGGFTYNYVGVSVATPTMTGFTGPSGWAYSDTQFDVNRVAWKAFNGTIIATLDDTWESDGTAFPHWIAYKFTTPTLITQYAIAPRPISPSFYPKTWKFQGSTDGSIWVDLDSRTNITVWSSYVFNSYTAANTTAYQYYRLYVTAGSDANYVQLAELRLLAPGATIPLAYLQYDGSLTSKWRCGGDTGPSEIITANHAQSMANKLTIQGNTGVYSGIRSTNISCDGIAGVTGIFTGSVQLTNKSMMSPDGGFCIALTAQQTMKRGTVVQASTTSEGNCSINPTDGDMPIGSIWGNAADNGTTAIAGSLAWVTIAGVGFLTMGGTTGLIGQVAYSGATGTADAASTIPVAATHFKEVGHIINSTGPGGTAKAVFHFN